MEDTLRDSIEDRIVNTIKMISMDLFSKRLSVVGFSCFPFLIFVIFEISSISSISSLSSLSSLPSLSLKFLHPLHPPLLIQ